MRSNERRQGFSFKELIVVASIVAMIAALSFAVFSRVRESGRRTVCQSNLRQIALAIEQYKQDNNGYFPSFDVRVNSPFQNTPFESYGELAPYIKDTRVFTCPSHGGPEEGTSYIYNAPVLWGAFVRHNNLIHPVGQHETLLKNTASIWMNMDVGWGDGAGNIYGERSGVSSCGKDFSGGTLHNGGGNHSFVDGHVKWLTPEQLGELECSVPSIPPITAGP